ncbi:MAG: DUF6152 family protein [Woeseiaceae bacterium]|jgi:hypothetical protein|nr:DUF6152 family protein [Woeseiaceae bacterium]
MIKFAALLLTMLTFAPIIVAHHSSAMFDKAEIRDVTATVREFQWTNPHIWIQIVLATDEGNESEWSIEGLGPNSLFRNGWRPNSFKAGDVVQIRFNPMRDGSNAGGFIGAKFADGRTIGRWD